MRTALVFAVLLPLVLADAGAAQRLSPEQRIRVTAPQLDLRRQPGRLVWLDEDSLVLVEPSRRWAVPRPWLTEIESSRGHRRHTLLGLAAGGLVGLAAGAILLSPGSNACTGSGNYAEYCRLYRAGMVVGGAGLGAVVGALIRSERWAPLRPESLEFAPAP